VTGAILVLERLISFYELLIFAYIILSWFRPTGVLFDVYRTLGTLTEPWLGIFRKLIPPVGAIDFSPMVALIALQAISSLLFRLLR
jgi:uncharacterized protein YggT (Ycf19 family)